MYNPIRGDVTLTLGGEEYILRPTFSAIANFEAISGKSIIKCYADLLNANIRGTDVVSLIYAGIHGYNPDSKITRGQLTDLVMQDGVVNVALEGMDVDNPKSLSTLGQFIHNMVYGGVAITEKEEAQDAKKSDPPTPTDPT